jgi:hypothetical protein
VKLVWIGLIGMLAAVLVGVICPSIMIWLGCSVQRLAVLIGWREPRPVRLPRMQPATQGAWMADDTAINQVDIPADIADLEYIEIESQLGSRWPYAFACMVLSLCVFGTSSFLARHSPTE